LKSLEGKRLPPARNVGPQGREAGVSLTSVLGQTTHCLETKSPGLEAFGGQFGHDPNSPPPDPASHNTSSHKCLGRQAGISPENDTISPPSSHLKNEGEGTIVARSPSSHLGCFSSPSHTSLSRERSGAEHILGERAISHGAGQTGHPD